MEPSQRHRPYCPLRHQPWSADCVLAPARVGRGPRSTWARHGSAHRRNLHRPARPSSVRCLRSHGDRQIFTRPTGPTLAIRGQLAVLKGAIFSLHDVLVTKGTINAPLFEETLRLLRYRSEEHTSELQSLMRISYAVFCLKKKKKKK